MNIDYAGKVYWMCDSSTQNYKGQFDKCIFRWRFEESDSFISICEFIVACKTMIDIPSHQGSLDVLIDGLYVTYSKIFMR